MQVVAHLVVEPSIEWTRQDGTVLNASSGSSLQLNFNPVVTSNGSNYTCQASVNITGVVYVTGHDSRNIIVICKWFFSLITITHCISSPPVPQPTVNITRSHSGSVYAGTVFALRADISFSDPSGVDVDILLDISWSRGSDVIENDTVTTVSAVSGSGDSYTASLNYSPITTSDSGLITATVTVSPDLEPMYIQNVMANDTKMLTVEGIYNLNAQIYGLMLTPLPTRPPRSSGDYLWTHYWHGWRGIPVDM